MLACTGAAGHTGWPLGGNWVAVLRLSLAGCTGAVGRAGAYAVSRVDRRVGNCCRVEGYCNDDVTKTLALLL